MKTMKLKTVIGLAMLILLAGACGKDKKKSNGCAAQPFAIGCSAYGAYNPYLGNLGSGNLAYDTSAMTQVQAWFNNASEGAGTYLGSAGLIDFSDGGFKIGLSSDYCYRLVGGIYQVGKYNKVSGTNYCSNMVSMPKQNNAKLIEAMNGGGLQLLDVKVIGSQYILAYGYNVTGIPANQNQAVRYYVIDTNKHSILNPVEVLDVQTGDHEYLYAVKPDNTLKFQ